MRTVAIINHKGGCGKTTTAVNLAGALAALGRPTLLVDLDPQSHCAAALSVPEDHVDLSSADLFLTEVQQGLTEGHCVVRVAVRSKATTMMQEVRGAWEKAER